MGGTAGAGGGCSGRGSLRGAGSAALHAAERAVERALPADGAVELGRGPVWVVHGNGLDELTTTGPSTVLSLEDGHVTTFTVDPVALGLAPAIPEELVGEAAERRVHVEVRTLGRAPLVALRGALLLRPQALGGLAQRRPHRRVAGRQTHGRSVQPDGQPLRLAHGRVRRGPR